LNPADFGDRAAVLSTSRLQFLRFAIVGAAGFVVDAGCLYLVVHELGGGLYVGRLVSYLTAASFTWALNRRYTFGSRGADKLTREWLKFLAANAAGGLINYGVYAVLVSASEIVSTWPVIGVAAGSLAGLIANFFLSRRFVFGGR
jgi:putative flippase GtrA